VGSGSLDTAPTPPPELRPQLTAPLVPPGIPAAPPGLSAPPGIPAPSRPPRVDSASPQTPLLASQSSYQMSTAARALLDEVKGRRETLLPSTAISPFPDFDRTLKTLSGDGGFSFNLDPKLAGEDIDTTVLPDIDAEASVPFHGSFTDAFPALRPGGHGPPGSFFPPPGLSYGHNPNRSIYDPMSIRSSPIAIERQSTGGSSYTGAFNPFSEPNEETNSPSRRAQYSPLEDDSSRKVSRFGFARGRRGSTAASSPMHVSSPLSNGDNQASFYNSADSSSAAQPQWLGHPQEYPYSQPGSSPMLQHGQVQATLAQQQHQRFQPFSSDVNEVQLREMIQSSRGRGNSISAPGPSGMQPLFV
jgi:CCR4-NOT transcription complex subunit 4